MRSVSKHQSPFAETERNLLESQLGRFFSLNRPLCYSKQLAQRICYHGTSP
jgi:hypothetical protein